MAGPEVVVTLHHNARLNRFGAPGYVLHLFDDCVPGTTDSVRARVRRLECYGAYAVAPEFPFTVLGNLCAHCERRRAMFSR